jgi:hypothetical protein
MNSADVQQYCISYCEKLTHCCFNGFHFAAPAHRRTPGHIYVPALTPSIQGQPHAARAEGGGVRSLYVGEFIQQGKTNFTHVLGGTDVPGWEVHKFTKPDGQEYRHLSADEAISILEEYLVWRGQNIHPASAARKFTLLVDRDPAHKAKVYKDFCSRQGIDLLILPPHSHDLTPLDSHFFAVAKRKHAKNKLQAGGYMPWLQRAVDLLHELQVTDPNPHFRDYRLKLQACIDANGGRFMEELKALRAAENEEQ